MSDIHTGPIFVSVTVGDRSLRIREGYHAFGPDFLLSWYGPMSVPVSDMTKANAICWVDDQGNFAYTGTP